jgi:predicted nucleic acid-binding protein
LQHVFVETNWLVECLAPAHHKEPAALDLLDKAKNGEVTLYLPSICLAECQRPIRDKFQVKPAADRVRKFLLWAKSNGTIESVQEETVRRTLVQMESLVKRDLDHLVDALKDLCCQKGVEVFHIEEDMWVRTTELSYLGLQLQPFDQAILASILIKAEKLQKQGLAGVAFCEVDSDLQPWDRTGEAKEPLVRLYAQASIWVYGDFLMQRPKMPEDWSKKVEKARESK